MTDKSLPKETLVKAEKIATLVANYFAEWVGDPVIKGCIKEKTPLIAAALAAREREVRADERQKVWGEAINVINYSVETMTRFAHRDFEAARNEGEVKG